MRHWADRIDAAALAKQDFDYTTRAQIRNDVGYAVRLCRNAVDLLLNAQGASSFADSNPLQRIWRDLETASRHAILNPDISQEVYGKALLGVEERITPLV
jgi:alkylation response protein AidB-like acyl-CoA dehydrogenase